MGKLTKSQPLISRQFPLPFHNVRFKRQQNAYRC